jgi:catechol 2,3-dioxygenase-like lactoylglutathione lyase family enzyme
MFTEIASVPVLVKDAKKSAESYREKLGFEASIQGHWVEAKPKGSSTVLHLGEKCNEWRGDSPGGNTGIFIRSDDKAKTYQELKAKGVEFSVELTEASWGTYAIFKDPDGNEFWI